MFGVCFKTSQLFKDIFTFYTCQVVLDTIQKVGMEYEFYHVNTCLEIANPINIGHNEVLLYTNYFGLKDDYIIKLSKKFHNFILDNSQAFFSNL